MAVIQIAINVVCKNVLWIQVWNTIPVSGRMVVLIAFSVAALMISFFSLSSGTENSFAELK